MSSMLKTDSLDAKDINEKYFDNHESLDVYKQLKQREQTWWKSRQQLTLLRERQMFWFGDNSFMMWLLWQLVSYIVVAMVLMLLSKLLDISLPLWQYIALFVIQTLIFIVMLSFKDRLARQLQYKINQADLSREEMLNEMTILASDSLYRDVHAKAPISLKQIYRYYNAEFRLASLHRLLQKEVDAGRLMYGDQKVEADILPLELADDALKEYARGIIYKSLI
ncbi:hypothetical protein SC65A3_02105 [Psychrobacter sp. SC65A.3]|mgnify:FL=1|uniref:hypothetical protein n=1 Tax=Psychrobacter sp. SC65A.3 TaxID=2983299 RepID=UPI0021DA50BF|nr:hypothetical protein [Psychrobacter sp. SC65A.3]WAI88628.1 hypothetical protein SC65A3_02105 [Psychrobacter sp. SC65A.3]